MSTARFLPADANAPRFRIIRMNCGGIKEDIGHEEHPSDAMRRVFFESGHVVAVDRRGYIFADNHKETA